MYIYTEEKRERRKGERENLFFANMRGVMEKCQLLCVLSNEEEEKKKKRVEYVFVSFLNQRRNM